MPVSPQPLNRRLQLPGDTDRHSVAKMAETTLCARCGGFRAAHKADTLFSRQIQNHLCSKLRRYTKRPPAVQSIPVASRLTAMYMHTGPAGPARTARLCNHGALELAKQVSLVLAFLSDCLAQGHHERPLRLFPNLPMPPWPPLLKSASCCSRNAMLARMPARRSADTAALSRSRTFT